MSLIDAEELPELDGQDQTDQIRPELYAQVVQELTQNQMDLATNYSVLGKADGKDDFPTPMDWIIDQANKALAAFDAQFPKAETPEPVQTEDKVP